MKKPTLSEALLHAPPALLPSLPPRVASAIALLDLEVGDGGVEAPWLFQDEEGAFQLQLEGWGADCVMDLPVEERAMAIPVRAAELATAWAREGWAITGWWPIDGHTEVDAITWALHPVSDAPLQALLDEGQEIIDLRE